MQTFQFWSLTVERPHGLCENGHSMSSSPLFPNSTSTKNIPDHRSIGFSSKNAQGFKKFSILHGFDGPWKCLMTAKKKPVLAGHMPYDSVDMKYAEQVNAYGEEADLSLLRWRWCRVTDNWHQAVYPGWRNGLNPGTWSQTLWTY